MCDYLDVISTHPRFKKSSWILHNISTLLAFDNNNYKVSHPHQPTMKSTTAFKFQACLSSNYASIKSTSKLSRLTPKILQDTCTCILAISTYGILWNVTARFHHYVIGVKASMAQIHKRCLYSKHGLNLNCGWNHHL